MTDSLAKISAVLESAREYTLEAAAAALARLADTPSALRPQEIHKLLSLRLDRDALSGMKCVVSLLARGEDGLPYFADVVKNVTLPDKQVRQLVLIYLARYAEEEPDTALLSINSIQKQLSDKAPASRAAAIRALGGIRIPEILSLLLLCIKRTVADPSPVVRAATAIAVGKAYAISDINQRQLFDHLVTLIADADALVAAAAVKTFCSVQRHLKGTRRWEPIHGNYRRLVSILPAADEWTQTLLVDLLVEYARRFLPRPKLYYADGLVADLPDAYADIEHAEYTVGMDADLQIFLDALRPLVYLRSAAVVLSVARAVQLLAPPSTYVDLQLHAVLCRMASCAGNAQLLALQTISTIAHADSVVFEHQYRRFFVFPTDSASVAACKIDILAAVATEATIKPILAELKHYVLNSRLQPLVAPAALRALAKCLQVSPEWADRILKWCVRQIAVGGPALGDLLTVVRHLLQAQAADTPRAISMRVAHHLAQVLFSGVRLDAEAKATLVWIIGEFTAQAHNIVGPDVVRVLVRNYAAEPAPVRYQTLVLAAKVFAYAWDELRATSAETADVEAAFLRDNVCARMFLHVLHLAKYDVSYDTRDRARMLHVLLNTGLAQLQLASLFLQAPKPAPVFAGAECVPLLRRYLRAVAWADPDTLPPASVRKAAPVVTNNLSASVSLGPKTAVSVPVSAHAISSHTYSATKAQTTKETYKLQSLDEFFGPEAASDSDASEESDASSLDDDESGLEEDESGEEETDANSTQKSAHVDKRDLSHSASPTRDEALSYTLDDSDASSTQGFINK